MGKVFYKKGSKKNYKMNLLFDWFLKILILILIILFIFTENKIIIIGLICSFILSLIWQLKIEITLIRNLTFNAFTLNKETNDFYKVGVYPNFVGALPTEEDFMKDKYFLYDLYSGKFKFSSIFKNFMGLWNFQGTMGTTSILVALSKLHNEKYVLKQLMKKKSVEVIYKITNIYSVKFIEENNSYCVVCDTLKINNNKDNKISKKTEMYINKDFDISGEIKEYLEKNIQIADNI